MQIEFRDKYREALSLGSTAPCNFDDNFRRLLKDAEEQQRNKKTVMKSFDETKKAKKIRENKGELAVPVKKGGKKGKDKRNENEDNKENIPGM